MQKQFSHIRALLILTLLVLGNPLPCLGQNKAASEESIPRELRNRIEVEVIQEKLRILRKNDSLLGENHPNKKSIQAEIREYEFDLKKIVDLHKSMNAKGETWEGSANLEDSLPPQFAAREDVLPIIRKLKFLRMNNKYLGDNHPSKKPTAEQIRGHELSLKKMLDEDRLPSPKSLTSEQSQTLPSQNPKGREVRRELEDPRELRVTLQKLEVLKTNQATYGENHPNWKIIQAEIREHESKLRELMHASRMSF